MAGRTRLIGAALLLVACLSVMPAAAACVGDCDANGRVTIDELILGVAIVLGSQPADACPALAGSEQPADIATLVAAVANALDGCGGSASATPTTAATPTPTAVASATATAEPLTAEAACAALNGAVLGGAQLDAATLMPATTAHGEYCKVAGTIPPQLHFELRLPTTWSGRVLFVGGSGLDGFIPSPDVLLFNPSIGRDGYATIATDSGHQGSFSDGSWGLDDPLAVENFAERAVHSVLGSARAVIATRYGRSADHTYFFGYSEGGREGLIAAQRWPDDFDGIAALEPVYDLTALALAMNRVAQHVFATDGGRLTPAALDTLGHAVLDACDGGDGLVDGIIGNPGACRFDPAALRCSEAATDRCLTDAEIATVNAVHDGLTLDFALAHDVRGYPGWPIGHELAPTGSLGGWPYWILGSSTDPTSAVDFSLSDQILRFLVVHDPALDTLHFVPGDHAAALIAFSRLVDASDPDLSRFGARGGKLILWHGLADYAVSARSTAQYYGRVVAALGGQDTADRFVRFYTAPGVGHINDGPGAGTADFLGALTAWVEHGTAPGDLVATRLNTAPGAPPLTRPLCRYPGYPSYDGSGDPNDAASFHCADP
jgi:hypothetical protein